MLNKLTKLVPIFYKTLPRPTRGQARGLYIVIDKQHKDNKGLIAHERVHVRQFLRFALPAIILAIGLYLNGLYYLAPASMLLMSTHSILYRFSKKYRYKSEVEAFGYSVYYGDSRKDIYESLIRYYNLDKKYVLDNYDKDIKEAYANASKDFEELV